MPYKGRERAASAFLLPWCPLDRSGCNGWARERENLEARREKLVETLHKSGDIYQETRSATAISSELAAKTVSCLEVINFLLFPRLSVLSENVENFSPVNEVFPSPHFPTISNFNFHVEFLPFSSGCARTHDQAKRSLSRSGKFSVLAIQTSRPLSSAKDFLDDFELETLKICGLH